MSKYMIQYGLIGVVVLGVVGFIYINSQDRFFGRDTSSVVKYVTGPVVSVCAEDHAACLLGCATDACRQQCSIGEQRCGQCLKVADSCLTACTNDRCRQGCIAAETACRERG